MMEDYTLKDFNEYLVMLSEMDKIGFRRKIVLLEGYIHKIKNRINNQPEGTEKELKMIRLPNDHTYIENMMDMSLFTLVDDFETELFGNYNGSLIFIKK